MKFGIEVVDVVFCGISCEISCATEGLPTDNSDGVGMGP